MTTNQPEEGQGNFRPPAEAGGGKLPATDQASRNHAAGSLPREIAFTDPDGNRIRTCTPT